MFSKWVQEVALKAPRESADKNTMKVLGLVLLSVFLWQCSSQGPAVVPAKILPKPPVPAVQADDDQRSVSLEDFQRSAWAPLPPTATWKAIPGGAAVSLQDGRELTLTFVSPQVVRWWVPPASGAKALSPSARYPQDLAAVKVSETDGVLAIDTTDLAVRLKLSDLSWNLIRGDKVVLKTAPPQAAGRRLQQGFAADSAVRWFGPGLTKDSQAAKFWTDRTPNSEGTGPWAAPFVFGAGGTLPFAIGLDNSYQTYTRVTETQASLGALNGGLDLLVAADSRASGVVAALTELTGRPGVPPEWAHGTALTLPAQESGAFLRREALAIQTAAGPAVARPGFQTIVTGSRTSGPLPDLTQMGTQDGWVSSLKVASWPTGAGAVLPMVEGRRDWAARFDDQGLSSPLARMNNRLPALEAQVVHGAWQNLSPGLRPFLLAESGGLGSVRYALPEKHVVAGKDEAALAEVLALGMAGQGTPAIVLDLTPLAQAETKEAGFRSLLSWMMVPVLVLDWGPQPAAFWANLAAPDRQRLKVILDRRSEFRPLFAQMAREAADAGQPGWRPLWFDFPKDVQALAHDDEVLLDDTLLAAPAPSTGATRSVYLPSPGVWFNFWTGEEFGGGKSYDLPVLADKPLLFVRGGGFVPVREPESYVERNAFKPLTIHVFPGGRGKGTYWFDDGQTLNWTKGTYVETQVSYGYTQRSMELAQQNLNAAPGLGSDPYVLYRLHAVYKPQQVKIDDKAIPLYGDSWGVTESDRSAAWYENDHTLLIKTFRPDRGQTILMSF